MLSSHDIERVCRASHSDPFAVLGPHKTKGGKTSVRCFLPTANTVTVVGSEDLALGELTQRHPNGFFEGVISAKPDSPYLLRVQWASGVTSLLEDPYRFPPVLGEMDVWLLGEGTHLRPFEVLGAQSCTMAG
ncbi:MAG TPA: 1,4-alpha-glucan branching enzyme, partial [Rhodoferax sp.]